MHHLFCVCNLLQFIYLFEKDRDGQKEHKWGEGQTEKEKQAPAEQGNGVRGSIQAPKS